MTDLDKKTDEEEFLLLMDRLDLKGSLESYTNPGTKSYILQVGAHAKIKGYNGFATSFTFTEAGSFVEVGCYE